MSTLTRPMKFIAGLLSDKSLTRKAYLNALTVVLEYAASLVVGFIITPLMVAGLGSYLFGMWQILNRLIGYINPVSGRPGFALKATLSNQQGSTDYDQKRRYVGSTLAIWALFLPILIGIGGSVSWFAPFWVHAPSTYVWTIRAVAGLLVLNMIVSTLSSIPQVTLQGENLGYKRMGMSVVLVLAGGSLTWLALYLKLGIVGVAAAVVTSTLMTGLFYLWIVRTYAPWFGAAKPSLADARQMLGLSWWFMGWNLVTTLLLASDVVVLGLLNSVESVTNYSLTKYVPEMLIGVIVIVIFGIMPGLGGIIGAGNFEKAVHLREEINSFIWLVATTLGASILIWNRTFIGLWVGTGHYSGSLPNLLIVAAAMQLALIRSDGNIIDLTLRLSRKVLLGFLSVAISIAAAGILVGYFRMSVVGLCLGIMAGRVILSIGYPILIGRSLGIPWRSQLSLMYRPMLVTALLFAAGVGVDAFFSSAIESWADGWLSFLLSAGVTGILMLAISFFGGLSTLQRKSMLRRMQAVLATPDAPARLK
ncbi:MAG: oligosaccharide flippase family protein [Chloroflexi bacterium]|nr:oligosaccharide flippase family protein [Chloroflexota bacterium]